MNSYDSYSSAAGSVSGSGSPVAASASASAASVSPLFVDSNSNSLIDSLTLAKLWESDHLIQPAHQGTLEGTETDADSIDSIFSRIPSGWFACDWNSLYQSFFDRSLVSSSPHEFAYRIESLKSLTSAFEEFSLAIARILVLQMERRRVDESFRLKFPSLQESDHSRSFGSAGGLKFIVGRVFFKFAADFINLYGDEEFSSAAALNEIRSGNAIKSAAVSDLHLTMTIGLRFSGHTILATALAPIDNSSLLCGTPDAGMHILNESPELSRRLRDLADYFHLAPHRIQAKSNGSIVELFTGCDVEGHCSISDGRFYICDLARFFPPVPPVKHLKNSHLFQLFRPEFLRNYSNFIPRLSSDSFSGFGAIDSAIHNSNSVSAFKELINRAIPAAAEKLINSLEGKNYFPNSNEIAQILHSEGVNVRYLSVVRLCLAEKFPSQISLRTALLAEILSRSVKSVIRRSNRKLNSTPAKKFLFERIFNLLLGRVGDKQFADNFWQFLMIPQVNFKFGAIPMSFGGSSAATIADGFFYRISLRSSLFDEFDYSSMRALFDGAEEIRSDAVRRIKENCDWINYNENQNDPEIQSAIKSNEEFVCSLSTYSLRPRIIRVSLPEFPSFSSSESILWSNLNLRAAKLGLDNPALLVDLFSLLEFYRLNDRLDSFNSVADRILSCFDRQTPSEREFERLANALSKFKQFEPADKIIDGAIELRTRHRKACEADLLDLHRQLNLISGNSSAEFDSSFSSYFLALQSESDIFECAGNNYLAQNKFDSASNALANSMNLAICSNWQFREKLNCNEWKQLESELELKLGKQYENEIPLIKRILLSRLRFAGDENSVELHLQLQLNPFEFSFSQLWPTHNLRSRAYLVRFLDQLIRLLINYSTAEFHSNTAADNSDERISSRRIERRMNLMRMAVKLYREKLNGFEGESDSEFVPLNPSEFIEFHSPQLASIAFPSTPSVVGLSLLANLGVCLGLTGSRSSQIEILQIALRHAKSLYGDAGEPVLKMVGNLIPPMQELQLWPELIAMLSDCLSVARQFSAHRSLVENSLILALESTGQLDSAIELSMKSIDDSIPISSAVFSRHSRLLLKRFVDSQISFAGALQRAAERQKFIENIENERKFLDRTHSLVSRPVSPALLTAVARSAGRLNAAAALLSAIDEGRCSYSVSGSTHIFQPFFHCTRCDPERKTGFCAACSIACHSQSQSDSASPTVSASESVSDFCCVPLEFHGFDKSSLVKFYCDCGAGELKQPCKLRKTQKQSRTE